MRLKKYLLLFGLFFLSYSFVTAQVVKPFSTRLAGGNVKIKGDIVYIGNNIINRTAIYTYPRIGGNIVPTPVPGEPLVLPTLDASGNPTNLANLTTAANIPYDGDLNNNRQNLEYIDIDNDPTTFSSSSANLNIANSCKRIVYAGLYWTASYPYDRVTNIDSNYDVTASTPIKNDWNQIKFKVPGGNYIDIIADNAADPVGDEDDIIVDVTSKDVNNNTPYNNPYVCYKNVTNLLKLLPTANLNGDYFVANQRASRGRNPNGNSGGWSLVVIYENPTMPSKYITVFDGFTNIFAANPAPPPQSFVVSGFQTLPAPLPVKAKVGVSALEGDRSLTGDNFAIKSNSVVGLPTTIYNSLNPINNFFNGTISNFDPAATGNGISNNNRLPASKNTLGFDLDNVYIDNPSNTVIPNGETGAALTLTTSGDSYGAYLVTFAVDIIEPDILLTKTVLDESKNNTLEGQNLKPCQNFYYRLTFKNTGNDSAKNLVITDKIPINLNFKGIVNDDLFLPPGVSLVSYDKTNRLLTLKVADNIVRKNDPEVSIDIKMQVACDCSDLDDACADEILNQAFSTYNGVENTNFSTPNPRGSIASLDSCGFGIPSSTNKLVDLNTCKTSKEIIFCGNTVNIKAAGGYQTYTWSGPSGATITPVAGTNGQEVTVNMVGTYTVKNSAVTPCRSFDETFIVKDYNNGVAVNNPIKNENVDLINPNGIQCPNNGIILPHIYLCSASDTRLLDVTASGASNNVVWEKLTVGASCPASTSSLCPNDALADSCWSQVGTGNTYTAISEGEYRITLTFQGCKKTFYFRVYKNDFNPTVTKKDIVCTTPGSITVTNVPLGYEYGAVLQPATTVSTWYTNNQVITIPTNGAGLYTVYIRKIGFPNSCPIVIKDILIENKQMTVSTTVTQPLCFGDKGTIILSATGVNPQYTFTLTQGATVIGSLGPQNFNTTNPRFNNLNPGTYNYNVTTTDGCNVSGTVTINSIPELKVSAAITKPLLPCSDGEITITASGGNLGYSYIINGAPSTINPVIIVPQTTTTAVTYNIQVVDSNNCKATTSITITPNPAPTFTVTPTNVKCYGDLTGGIAFNVTNAGGFTLGYSITGGAPFSPTPVFSNIGVGTYNAVIQYTLAGISCTTPPQTITITSPSTALTASGGVMAVACDNLGGKGTLRITNPQGGTPPYEYNFGTGYQASNQQDVLPGTYDISIRDANGCEYFMKVTLDPIPLPPTITVTDPVYNCNGTSNNTVTINNTGTGSYTYTYSINPPLVPPHNANSNVFTNVPCGTPTVTVNYSLVNPPTFSNLLFEDFGRGPNTTSPGISPAYCYNAQPYPPNQPCGNFVPNVPQPTCFSNNQFSYFLDDNQYVVTNSLNPNNCAWFPYKDHTSNGTIPNARFLAVNVGSAAGAGGILYSKVINDVIPNQPVNIELYAANLIYANITGAANPYINLELTDLAGNQVAILAPINNTGTSGLEVKNTTDGWQKFSIQLNPGNNTNLRFNLRSGSVIYNGNDLAIDDIKVYQLPITCLTKRDFPLSLPCNKAFAAQVIGHKDNSCFGVVDGTITIAAQNFGTVGYQYSLNNGGSWSTEQLTSPITVTIPSGYPGFVLVRYAGLPINTACSFNLPQPIATPTKVVASATAIQPTCLVSGSITGSATGGTPGYEYQLTGTTTPGNVAVTIPYKTDPLFSNLAPGTYILTAKDSNGCSAPISNPIVITAPSNPVIQSIVANCPTGPNTGVLTVTTTGGLGIIRFNIDGGIFQTSGVFTGLAEGSHTIIVQDANGCQATQTAIVPAQLTTSLVLTKDLDCTITSPNALITGTITGGTAPYTVVASPAGTVTVTGSTYTYTATTSGTYSFTVTDSKANTKCTATNSITINPKVNPTANATSTLVTCSGLADGTVTITPSSGTAPYSISFNLAAFTPITGVSVTYNALSAGTYSYTIRDSKSCPFNGTVTVGTPSSLIYTGFTITPLTCPAGSNASITITGVSGGTPGYGYSIDGVSFQSGNTLNNLAAGNYTVIVKDNNDCKITIPVTIPALTPPTDLSFAPTTLNCNIVPPNTIAGRVSVTLSTTGGKLSLQYRIVAPAASITTYQASSTFNNLLPGIYTFEVLDAAGCTYQESYEIKPLLPLTVVGNATKNVVCINTATGTGTFTVSNFGTSYAYTIAPFAGYAGASGTLQTLPTLNLTGLIAGTYNITVTNSTTNCTATASFTITAPPAALTAPVTTIPVTCLVNGQATVNATGGWGGYTYSISPTAGVVQSGSTFTNLLANTNYTITTTDVNGCSVNTPVNLPAPSNPTATISPLSDFCYDGVNQSTIVVNASGGIPPYSYSLNGGNSQAGNTFPNLTPGTYTITVRDSYGCTFVLPVQTVKQELTASISSNKGLDCTTSPNAVITGTISGGTPPYLNAASNPPGVIITGNNYSFSTATAGNYSFTFNDSSTPTCSVTTASITIASLPALITGAALTPTDVKCNGASDGAITVNMAAVTGGTAPYNFEIFGPNSTTISLGTQVTNLAAGTYTVVVTDSKSCKIFTTTTINQPAVINFTTNAIDLGCDPLSVDGVVLGSVTASATTGGTAPYTYTLTKSGDATFVPVSSGATLATSHTFANLNFGTYIVEVKDANNCFITKNQIVASPPNDISIVGIPTTVCLPTPSSTMVVQVGSIFIGFGSYTFTYVGNPNPPQVADPGFPLQSTFTGLLPGTTYTFIVKNNAKCEYYKDLSTPPTPATIVLAPTTPKGLCGATNNGSAGLVVSNINAASTQLTFEIRNSLTNVVVPGTTQTINIATLGTFPIIPFGSYTVAGAPKTVTISDFGSLPQGTYYFNVSENGGPNAVCTKPSASFTITIAPPTPVALNVIVKNANCNSATGTITVKGSNGVAPYQYQFLVAGSPAPSTASWFLSDLVTPNPALSASVFTAAPGNYDVYIRDTNGCTATTTAEIKLDTNPAITIALDPATKCNLNEGGYKIDVVTNTTVGVRPFKYRLDSGTFAFQLSDNFSYTNLSSGSHTVYIEDANGCRTQQSITILPPIKATAPVTYTSSTCGNNGVITVNASGGSGSFTYSISPLAGTQLGNVFSGLPGGTYTVTITDTHPSTPVCSLNIPAVVVVPDAAVSFTETIKNVSCNGGNDGSIVINLISAANPNYTYALTAGPAAAGPFPKGPQASNVFVGLPAGNYTVEVVSGRNCSATKSIPITQPNILDVTVAPLVYSCAPNNTVSVTVTLLGSGGTGTYNYSDNGVLYIAGNLFTVIQTNAVQNLTYYIRDANDCVDTVNVTIPALNPLSATIAITKPITCTDNKGEITVTGQNGTAPYTYQTVPVGAANITQIGTTNVFEFTAPGDYIFLVTDNIGCTATIKQTIAPYNTIKVTAVQVAGATCSNSNDGTVQINVTGYTGAYSYDVKNSVGVTVLSGNGNTSTNPYTIPSIPSGLPIGVYTVTVTETAVGSTLCSATATFGITGPSPLGLNLVSNTNANCNTSSLARVVVQGTGGTPNYTYAAVPTGSPAPVAAAYVASNIFSLNTATPTWDIYVKDSRGCIIITPLTVTIGIDPTPSIGTSVPNQCTASNGTFTIDVALVAPGIAPYRLTIDGVNYSSVTFPYTIPNLNAGVHTVKLSDANNCGNTQTVTVYDALSIKPVITQPTCPNNDGVISLTTTGGSGSGYTYTISPISGVVNNALGQITGLSAGTYTVTVTDPVTLCTKPVTVTLTLPIPVTFALSQTPVICIGDSNGIITANLLPGNNDFAYTYAITSGPVTRAAQTSNVFTGLPAGNYIVEVTSGRNCKNALPITVGQPIPLTAPAPTVVQFNCNAGTNGVNYATITVNGVAGGTGPYKYDFVLGGVVQSSGPSNVYIETNVLGGNYTVNVYDSVSCLLTLNNVVINPYVSISNIAVNVTSPITCIANESIAVVATLSGGTAALNYTVTGIGNPYNQTNITGIFTGLAIGDYKVTVTNTTTNCTVETIHFVNDPNTFVLNANKVSDVQCVGGSDGSVNLTIVDNLAPNNAGPFNYTITNTITLASITGLSATAGPTLINGLSAGVYSVTATLTGNPSCAVNTTFTILEPTLPLDLNVVSTPITCLGNDGIIRASATGGWTTASYQYELVGTVNVPYSANNVFTGLPVGTYRVNVKDANGCIDTVFPITLTAPAPINATVSASTLACFNDKATITIQGITGGQGSNYSYTINGPLPSTISSGPQLVPVNGIAVITDILAGNYTVDITDGWSCKNTFTVNIANPTEVKPLLSIKTAPTCVSGATLTLAATGGTGPYRYSVSPSGPYSATFASSIDIPGLPANTYRYYVRDANNCVSLISNDVIVKDVLPIIVTVTHSQNIRCSNDGAITVEAKDGLGGYTYTLYNASTNLPATIFTMLQPGVFTGLPAGSYFVRVTGTGGCIGNSPVVNILPVVPFAVTYSQTPVKCYGQSDGTITINATGGTGTIQYALAPVGMLNSAYINIPTPASYTITDLVAQDYQLIVQDQNGCFVAFTISITQPIAPLIGKIDNNSVKDEICFGDNNGAFTVTGIAGGTAPYFVSLKINGGTASAPIAINNLPAAGSHSFTGLAAGSYTVIITDANDCKRELEQVIEEGPDFSPYANVSFPCLNNVPAVEIEVVNLNNTPTLTFDPSINYQFSLDGLPTQLGNIFSSQDYPSLLVPGSHKVTVTNVTTCTHDTQTFTINPSDLDKLTVTLTKGTGLNQIVATASGGIGGYTYTFNGVYNGTDNVYIIERTDNYEVIVTDSSGCTAKASGKFEFTPIIIPDVFTPNGDGNNETWSPKNTENYKNLEVFIYDRYGRKIAFLRLNEAWDGKYQGKELPSGDYWYVIRTNNRTAEEYVGHFTLYR